MEELCMPYKFVTIMQSLRLQNKCFTDFFIAFIPNIAFAMLLMLEVSLKKKRPDPLPLPLLVVQLLMIAASFTCLTLLLFVVDSDQVSLLSVLSIGSDLLLSVSLLVAYHKSFARHCFSLSNLVTLKILPASQIVLISFKVVSVCLSTDRGDLSVIITQLSSCLLYTSPSPRDS